MKKKILLIGGKTKLRSLSLSLIEKGYSVTAINKSFQDCLNLSEINKLEVVHGDGTKQYILEDTDAGKYDIAIALTPKDEDNLIICELCKKVYKIKKVISLISDPLKKDFFYKMGIDSVVCAISAVTNFIEQQTFINNMETVIPLIDGKIKILEIPVLENYPIVNKKLCEIKFPKGVIVGSILRGELTMIPDGETMILDGDILILISSNHQEQNTLKVIKGW